MFTVALIVHIMVSIVLIVSVLLQVGKGATIGSTFGGASSQTLFGSAGPTSLLGKLTTACAFIFMVTSLFLTYTSSKSRTVSIMSDVPAVTAPAAVEEGSAPVAPPAVPVQTAPAEQPEAKAAEDVNKAAPAAEEKAPAEKPKEAEKAAPEKKK